MIMIVVLELAIGFFLYNILQKNSKQKIENTALINEINRKLYDLENKIELYNELKNTVEMIENKTYKDTSLFAKVYADQRKVLFDIYTAKVTDKMVLKDSYIRRTTQDFHGIIEQNKKLEYKICKYEQLFPWIKQYENVNLPTITEEFYTKNNLPCVIYDQANRLEKEKRRVLEELESQKQIVYAEIAEEKKRVSNEIADLKERSIREIMIKENKIQERENYVNKKIKAMNLYYQLEEQDHQQRINTYIHNERMKLTNDRYRFNLDKKEILEQIEDKEQELAKKESKIKQEKTVLDKQKSIVQQKEELISLKVKDIPILAKHLAQVKEAEKSLIEEQLRLKRNPAIKAADELRKIKLEKSALIKKSAIFEYRLACYEQLVPWLADIDEEPLDSKYNNVFNSEYDNKDDAAGYWLTKEEYLSLSTGEKYQRALDRYMHRHKSNLEIGRDYERYAGYIYEKDGWNVEYRGIIDGYEDRGRDLICNKDGVTLIVQCKYWSRKKVIHENHINQLFGTTAKYYFEKNPHASFREFIDALLVWKTIKPVFRTSTVLSATAKEFAKDLEITVIENDEISVYPMIKCNINERNNERIYHLPFDQQYDNVKIDKDGEFFAMTVEEAEKAGFRRAKRWYSK